MFHFSNPDRTTLYKQSSLKKPYTTQSFIKRFWQYQNERIPILPLFFIITLLCFSISNFSDASFITIIAAAVLSTTYLVQIRASDEHKDFEHDNKFYPERPIQRGLITLKELANVKLFCVCLFLLLCIASGSTQVIMLGLIQQGYAFLTRKEFYLRDWLRPKFFAYNLIHYFQLLILTLLILSFIGIQQSSDIWRLFIYGVLMIFTIDIARKIRQQDFDKAEDTYSAVMGRAGSIILFITWSLATTLWTLYIILWQNQSNTVSLFILVLGFGFLLLRCYHYIKSATKRNTEFLQGSSFLLFVACSLSVIIAL